MESQSAANSSEFVIKVERRDFTNEIALAIEGLPEGVQATMKSLAPNAKETAVKLVVTDKVATGTNYQFSIVGIGTTADRTWRQRTVPVTLTVTAPERQTAGVAPAK
jgi:hypothetical protein